MDIRPIAHENFEQVCDAMPDEPHRRRDAGPAPFTRAEEEAAARGFTRIGLGVGLDARYGAAQRLYDRRGYTEAGYGVPEAQWGTVREGVGPVRYLVKPLAG